MLEARGTLSLTPELTTGSARGESIILPEGVLIEAPDAVEIQAIDSVRIEGELAVGPGGALISAGRRIEIPGRIVARGPIELVIREADGVVVIGGELLAASGGAAYNEARVEIRGRGSLRIEGRIAVENPALVAASEPSIRAAVYGSVEVAAGAEIQAGPGGRVELSTNARVVIASGATIVDDAAWTLGARAFESQSESTLDVADLAITAETTATLGPGARLSSKGEELALVAGTIAISEGAQILGEGEDGTSLRVEAAQRLEVREGAAVEAITPSCSRNGQVIVRVAGVFAGLGRVSLRGAPRSLSCPDSDPSGVLVVAHVYEGVFPVLPDASAIFGPPRVDPLLRIVVPSIDARTAGRWISRPFPASGPLLLERFDTDLPPETSARVALGLADTPDDEGRDFVPWDPTDPLAWSRRVDGAPFWVVRVELDGRRFDAPVARALELVPAP